MESYRIGVLWSTHTIRLACFRVSGIRSTLVHLVRLPIDTANVQTVSETVLNWARQHLGKDADVFVSLTLSEGMLFVKEVEVPSGSRKEVTEAIRWELITKNAAFPKESIVAWRYRNDAATSHTAVAYALRDSESELFRDTFAGNGWKVQSIESYSVSLARVYTLPGTVLHIDFAGNQASVVIQEAQIARYATLVDLPQSDVSGQAGTVTQSAVAALVSKVKQTFTYWQSRGNAAVTQVFVTGDDSGDNGVRKQLTKALGAEIMSPPVKKMPGVSLGKYRDHALTEYAPAIGAAVRLTAFRYDDDPDFLTRDARRNVAAIIARNQYADAARQLTVASVALLFVSIIVFAGSFMLAKQYQREIAQNRRFITNHPGQKLIGEVNTANSLTQSVTALLSMQQDTGSKLQFYAEHTPRDITYTTVKYASEPKREWVIEGTGTREAILAYYYELKEQAVGATVIMPYSSLSREKDAAFSIHILW